MQVKLDKISEWTTTGFELSNGAYQYAPINAKNHFARGKDEFVISFSSAENKFNQFLQLSHQAIP